jgi:hypothetical protein
MNEVLVQDLAARFTTHGTIRACYGALLAHDGVEGEFRAGRDRGGFPARAVASNIPGELRRSATLTRVALGIALLTWTATAQADVPGLALTWDAPETCPTTHEVEDSVAQLLGERGALARPLEARVLVTQLDARAWRADVTTRGAAIGTRALQGASCEAVALAAALVIALAISPEQASASVRSSPRTGPVPPKAAPAERTLFAARVFGGGIVRSLPRLAPEVGAGARIERGRVAGKVVLSYAAPQQISGPSPSRTELDRWSVAGFACAKAIAATAAAFDVCLGLELEHIAAQAAAVSNPGKGVAMLYSPALGLESRLRLARELSLVVGLRSIVRLRHPEFVIGGLGSVYAIPKVGGAFDTGLEYAF